MTGTACEWCRDLSSDDPAHPERLCLQHAAEYDGLTVDDLVRRDRIHYAEWLDSGRVGPR